jgi:hypothetical protein
MRPQKTEQMFEQMLTISAQITAKLTLDPVLITGMRTEN